MAEVFEMLDEVNRDTNLGRILIELMSAIDEDDSETSGGLKKLFPDGNYSAPVEVKITMNGHEIPKLGLEALFERWAKHHGCEQVKERIEAMESRIREPFDRITEMLDDAGKKVVEEFGLKLDDYDDRY